VAPSQECDCEQKKQNICLNTYAPPVYVILSVWGLALGSIFDIRYSIRHSIFDVIRTYSIFDIRCVFDIRFDIRYSIRIRYSIFDSIFDSIFAITYVHILLKGWLPARLPQYASQYVVCCVAPESDAQYASQYAVCVMCRLSPMPTVCLPVCCVFCAA
jgi:hypothetical protein